MLRLDLQQADTALYSFVRINGYQALRDAD